MDAGVPDAARDGIPARAVIAALEEADWGRGEDCTLGPTRRRHALHGAQTPRRWRCHASPPSVLRRSPCEVAARNTRGESATRSVT